MSEYYLEWEAPNFNHREKTTDWYWSLGLLGLIIIGFSLWLKNYLFSFLILIGTFTLLLNGGRRPELIKHGFNQQGIVVGEHLYPWPTLESYWIETRGHEVKLFIHSNKSWQPVVDIALGQMNVEVINNFLEKKLKKEHLQETPAMKIAHLLGF
jgi:hypothetical protein